jgi:nucleoside 2-deoxyribosyltransferase
MRVYLAAAWSRRAEIALVAEKLRAVGVEITSNWLAEEKAMQTGAMEKFLRDRAYIDLSDVDRADAIVRFTDAYVDHEKTTPWMDRKTTPYMIPSHFASGARMFEMGYAKARGKTMYVVGGKQNVFDRLDGVIHLKDVDELLNVMDQEDHGKRDSCPIV